MKYVTYTDRVRPIVEAVGYPFVDFQYKVDGSGYTVVKNGDGKYFEWNFTSQEMKTCPVIMASRIVHMAEKYFMI